MPEYTMTTTIDADLEDAERRVREALSEEGFGILSEIDVQAKLLEKLDEDVGPYKILGACNPPLAHQAIGLDRDIGALLPCNVLLRSDPDGGTTVAAADPEAMLELAGDDVRAIAADAKQRIARALDALN